MKIHSTVFKNFLTILDCLNLWLYYVHFELNWIELCLIAYTLLYFYICVLSIIIFNCNISVLFMAILLYYFILSIDLILEKNRIWLLGDTFYIQWCISLWFGSAEDEINWNNMTIPWPYRRFDMGMSAPQWKYLPVNCVPEGFLPYTRP
jgi:hypothetical protein